MLPVFSHFLMTQLTQALLSSLPLAEGSSPPGPGFQLIIFALLFLGMWFLIIAPQRKKQKEHEKLVASLQSGEEVLTSGGIYGTITNVKSDRFVVRIAENVKVEVVKSAVVSIVSKNDKA